MQEALLQRAGQQQQKRELDYQPATWGGWSGVSRGNERTKGFIDSRKRR
jgi:hypothetical protein